ncbi:MAG TPA: hypothetical protein VFT57_20095 [Gemmatimonadaceae bacterium]|jgi:hypothetical protein|nr:hypothetical protein [Gemmatimonadaceae bacterium]
MTRIGVALGLDTITAVTPRGDVWRSSFEPGALPEILGELRDRLSRPRSPLVVALLPPLVQVRRVELPALTDEELRRVLTRDVERYLPDVRVPQVAAAARAGTRRSSPVTYLIAAADAALVSSLYDAARKSGWQLASVVPAYAAWEIAGRHLQPAPEHQDGYLLLRQCDRMEALLVQRGRLTLVRRFRASVSMDAVTAALGELSAVPLNEPEVLAARYAPRVRGAGLVPDAVRAARARGETRWSVRMLAVAAALLVLAGALEMWGQHRELAAIRARRAALSGHVARAMQLRESIEDIQARLRTLARAESSASRWSAVVSVVAERLPRDAYLVKLRGAGDSLVLEGAALRAAGAFEALRNAPGISGVRADAPIRQEARDSQPPIERFTIGARLGAK